MILLTTPWTPSDTKAASAALIQARMVGDDQDGLALLPHGDGGADEARSEAETVAALSALAQEHGVFLAASAYVIADGETVPTTLSWLIGADGGVLLRTAKVMPDLVEGFTDTAAATFQPLAATVAKTPFGQIGLLCGEDILAPHVVRSLMSRGAEVILNPSRERNDDRLSVRLLGRRARAYENVLFVATASASTVTIAGGTVTQPAATGLFRPAGGPQMVAASESFIVSEMDVESLRRRRLTPMLNFPAIVRMNLYAPGYESEQGEAKASPHAKTDWIAEGKRRIAAQAKPPRPEETSVYGCMLGQHVVHQSTHPDQLVPKRQKNLDDAFDLIRNYGARSANLKLVVFPEFFLTGPVSPLGSKLGHIADKIGVTFPGPEMDQVAAFAQEIGSYVAGGVFEYDPDWPQRFFNTAFIYDDQGNLVHRYRKIHCGDAMGFLPDTTPGSVYDQYVDKYGYEYLYPVADTPIGRLATTICFDNNFAETYRAMAKRGAEVIIHPTSEPHGAHRGGWDSARRMRAFENTAYVLSCGHGGEYFLPDREVPSARGRGYSKIINFDGSVQAEADTSGQVPLGGMIDLNALRAARANPRLNYAAWDEPLVYVADYAKSPAGLPNNLWPDDPLGNPYENGAQIKKVVNAYLDKGVFVAPCSGQERKAAE